jgi:hypothetical protein
MRTRIFLIVTVALVMALAGALAKASDNNEGERLIRVYIDHVKPGHRVEYFDVTREWNACLEAGEVERGWSAYESQTGKLLRYAFVVYDVDWAYFDREHETHKACFERFEARYAATLEHTTAQFDVFLPDASHHVEQEEGGVVMTTSFRVRGGPQFLDNIKKVAEAARDAEWPEPFYFYSSVGGPEGADFYVVSPRSGYAGFEDRGFWDMVRSRLGDEEMARMGAEIREVVIESWTDIWERVDELSFEPE